MQLAYDHVERMLETHHVESFKNMVLLRGDILHDYREHRRIDIVWKPGSKPEWQPLLQSLHEYEGKGYRCIDATEGGLRLVRGKLTAEEELRYKLESRSFLNFDHQGNTIKMVFATRTKEELNKYEKDTLDFFKTIKDYSIIYDHDGATLFVTSYRDGCETCSGKGTIDERMGGISTSNPEALCPDCKGESVGCSDCKDGYYYPLIGMRERCQTCKA